MKKFFNTYIYLKFHVGLEKFFLVAKNVVKNRQLCCCLKVRFGYVLRGSRSFQCRILINFHCWLFIVFRVPRKIIF